MNYVMTSEIVSGMLGVVVMFIAMWFGYAVGYARGYKHGFGFGKADAYLAHPELKHKAWGETNERIG